MIKELTYHDFDKTITQPLPVVVEFYSPTCTHCKRLEAGFKELSEEINGQAVFAKCDITKEDSLAAQYDITSVPTLLFIRDGEIKEKLIGFTHKLIIEETLKKI
ncbi:MAG: thioredoxin family protein [Clostridiales bacterium]|nr:thioredoxin family protein [Clostridiales bacterium]